MSTVKIEPFSFDMEEDGVQISPEQFPGAIETPPATEEKDKSKEESEAKPKTTQKDQKSQNVVVDNDEEEEDKEEDDNHNDPLGFFGGNTKEKSGKDKTEDEDVKISADKVDYKAFSDYFVETGIWKDFEGRDSIEYNEETFQALWKAQADNTVKEYLTEERSAFGDVANQMIDYLKTGGTIDDFVSNYTQQLEVSSLDTTDELGQERAIKEYYKSLDWSDTKIKKHIERLKDSGDSDFKEEAEDCKTKLVEAIEEERTKMLKEQEAIAEDRRLRSEKFNKAVREVIYKDTDLADREKKDLDKFVYEYKYQDDQGRKYSEFAVKMGEINQDPAKYAKFLKFVKNIDSFEDKKAAQKEVTKSTFNFLKKGSNPLEGAQGAEPIKQKAANSPPAFKFK